MKFRCREVGDEKDWHKWFAWYPVKVGANDIRWLETVMRRGKVVEGWQDLGLRWIYSYRPVCRIRR